MRQRSKWAATSLYAAAMVGSSVSAKVLPWRFLFFQLFPASARLEIVSDEALALYSVPRWQSPSCCSSQ